MKRPSLTWKNLAELIPTSSFHTFLSVVETAPRGSRFVFVAFDQEITIEVIDEDLFRLTNERWTL